MHLIRNSLSYCNWKQRQPVARELKHIYVAETAELAAKRLEEFAEGPWAKKLPAIVQSWRRVWEQVIPFFVYPNEIRKIIYTTNAIESLHMQLRKVLKNRRLPGNWQPANLRSNSEKDFPRSPQTKNHEKVESCFQRLE